MYIVDDSIQLWYTYSYMYTVYGQIMGYMGTSES